ncbi:MAG: sulfotransferase family protein [Actinobacteria bacterium]|nr:sulfotransferase family protein [Actinomycetota bacterium]
MDDRLILVAGSGRSGTSLFSGILKALGCHVPQPEVEADNTNPRGFGEPQWVVDFHTRLLARAKVQTADARPVAWSATATASLDRGVEKELQTWLAREFDLSDYVVIKDPRILWFLPLWTTVGNHLDVGVRYATVLRHPSEVIKSKIAYYGDQLNPSNRTAGWINTMLYTERATRSGIRTFLKYEDLLNDWTVEIAKVGSALDLPMLDQVPASHIREASQLVDPSLRRSQTDWETLGVHEPVAQFAEETWKVLDRLATTEDVYDPSLQQELDALRDRYVDFYDLIEATAYSSILAARREERDLIKGAAQARSFAGRMKRKARRTLGKIKRRILSR